MQQGSGQNDDARHRRVHPALLAPRAAIRLPQDPALRSGRDPKQKIQARQRTRATRVSGKGPKPRPGSAFRRSAYHHKAALPSLWREQLGMC